MNLSDFKKTNLPDKPGVYFFKKGQTTLYIGKATSLRDRVRSYLKDDLIHTRGRLLVDMVVQADKVDFEETDSVLEAFILESELIKKYQPKYNTKEKDNKSFNYVVITKEDFPRVLVVRGRNLELAKLSPDKQQELLGYEYTDVYGPYPYGAELRSAMKLIRKIFPYRDMCQPYTGPKALTGRVDKTGAYLMGAVAGKGKPCFNRSIGLCPGVCTGEISKKDYAVHIRNLRLFFTGKKTKLVAELEKQMREYAKKHEFEKAGEVKKTLYALQHIQDISMIKKESNKTEKTADKSAGFRIEAYDIAHMSGKDMVGAMVVMEDGVFEKSQYKIFNIKTVDGSNDTGALKEVLERRLAHRDWQLPDMMVLDGGTAQLNTAEKILQDFIKNNGTISEELKKVQVVSVVKDDKHKAREVMYSTIFKGQQKNGTVDISVVEKMDFSGDEGDIVSINQECHRFAILTHKKKRSRSRGL